MTSKNDDPSFDPHDRLTEPAPSADAAGYLIEMLASMSHFAHISNLHNSSVMLAAASQVVGQECRLITEGPPNFRSEPPPDWTTLFSDYSGDQGSSG